MSLWLMVLRRWRQAFKLVLTGLLLLYCSTSITLQYLQLSVLTLLLCLSSFFHSSDRASQGSLGEQVTCLLWAPSFMNTYQSGQASSSIFVMNTHKESFREQAVLLFHKAMLNTIYQSFAEGEMVAVIISHSKYFPLRAVRCQSLI